MLKINNLSHEGRGVSRLDGKVVFVHGALPEESVEIKTVKKRRQFIEAQALSIDNPSPERVNPPCPHYSVCGGCSLQHLAPQAQVAFKQSVLKEQFVHFGQLQPDSWLSPLTGPTLGYRQKARLSVRYVEKKGGIIIGFRERFHSGFVADIQSCHVLHPTVAMHFDTLKDFIAKLSVARDIPQCEIAVGDTHAAIILRHLAPLSEEDIEQAKAFTQATNIHLYSQSKGLASIKPLSPTVAAPLYYSHPDFNLTLQFEPFDFTQVNNHINQTMVKQALALLDLKPDETVLDLFCGLGNFTLPLALQAKKVIGIEGEESLVERARNNATRNQISNTEFYTADLFAQDAFALFKSHNIDKCLIDPPRSGAEMTVKNIDKLKPKKIVYVSCNPATLARDAGILVNQHHYKLTKAGIMDMFPHTAHIESMALFEL